MPIGSSEILCNARFSVQTSLTSWRGDLKQSHFAFGDKAFSFIIVNAYGIQDVVPHNVNLDRWHKSNTMQYMPTL